MNEYIESIKQGSIESWFTNKILPSVVGAQAILESGYGGSKLAKDPYWNQFGIKASPDWTGKTVTMTTTEYVNGSYVSVPAEFRTYPNITESIKDHANFFSSTEWRKTNYRYVVGETNYRVACEGLQKAGYATDPHYASKLIAKIEQHGLQEWDQQALDNQPTGAVKKDKTVGGALSGQAVDYVRNISVTVIGDSLGVGTKPKLEAYNFKNINFNVYGSRQWTHAQDNYNAIVQLRKFVNDNTLNQYVIFILGTNRGATADEIDRAVNLCGSNRTILLVDTASEVVHRQTVANTYYNASIQYDNVYYVDWSRYAIGSIATWYVIDGINGEHIHMTPTGYQKHAEYIIQALFESQNNNFNRPEYESSSKDGSLLLDIDYKDDIFEVHKGESIIYNRTLNDRFGFKTRNSQEMWIDGYLQVNSDDPQEMLKQGIEYMKQHKDPSTQYVVPLKELPTSVAIGDVGLFIDHDFNPPLYIEARILEIRTSDTNPSQNQVTIGNVKEVYAQKNSELKRIQSDLGKLREDLKTELYSFNQLDLSIESTNGFILNTSRRDTDLKRYKSTRIILDYDGNKYYNYTVDLKAPEHVNSTFYIRGRFLDILKPDINNTDTHSVDVPIEIHDKTTNPQGLPVPENELKDNNLLKLTTISIKILDNLDGVIFESNMPIYQDGTFNYPINGLERAGKKLIIQGLGQSIIEDLKIIEDLPTKTVDASTQLRLIAKSNGIDVTNLFSVFKWSRISKNNRLDEAWNDKHKFYLDLPTLNVFPEDVESGEATFVCTLYNDDVTQSLGSVLAVVKTQQPPVTPYDLAIKNGFQGTELEWIESLRGRDGSDGEAGENGTFQHVAWADSPLGENFSTSEAGERAYVGFYTDNNPADPQDFSLYIWQYVKGPVGRDGAPGPPGQPGQPGPKGEDGKTSYIHYIYANKDETGTFIDLSFTDPKRDWEGVYTDFNETGSTNPFKYVWKQSTYFLEQNKVNNIDLDNTIRILSENTQQLKSLSTELDVTKANVMITNTTEIMKTITKLVGDASNVDDQIKLLEQVIEPVKTYFKFDTKFTIAKSNTGLKIEIDNQVMNFKDGETVMAWLSGNIFNAQNIVVKNGLSWPSHKAESQNGLLNFRYIGG